MEIGRSTAATGCGDVSIIVRKSEKNVTGRREELRREIMTALLAMNVSQSKEVERTKAGTKWTTEERFVPGSATTGYSVGNDMQRASFKVGRLALL